MSLGSKQPPPTDLDLLGIDVSTQPTNQEAIPIPYVAGEYSIAAQWISPIYNQQAIVAPSGAATKK